MGLAVDHNVCKKRSFREYKYRLYIFPLTQIPKSFSDMQQTFVTSKILMSVLRLYSFWTIESKSALSSYYYTLLVQPVNMLKAASNN